MIKREKKRDGEKREAERKRYDIEKRREKEKRYPGYKIFMKITTQTKQTERETERCR